jgi:hypothetical protein
MITELAQVESDGDTWFQLCIASAGLFAAKAAPTGIAQFSKPVISLWERL